MSRILYLEPLGGASGDMLLAALLDLGVAPEQLEQGIRSLPVEDFHLTVSDAVSRGISGRQVHVHVHDTEAGHHHHGPEDTDHHHHDHPHRGIREIRDMIEAADLPAPVKAASLDVFRRIAEAEAAIHGMPVEDVHFHEVGAMDSIVDIVGACIGLHALGVEDVIISPIPQGTGTIECAHGTYPNPAPATVKLCEGLTIRPTDEPHELVTPTGAALMASWRTRDLLPPGLKVTTSGYAVGHRELNSLPNVLRATLYETERDAAETRDTCVVLESNIDDCTPELVGVLMQELLEAGALDVFATPVTMKKQRPGMLLTVLADPANRDVMMDRMFRGTTTFGIREYTVNRTKLSRRHETVETVYGPVRIKIGSRHGEDLTASPEMDDCVAAAKLHGVPVRSVYEAAACARSRSPGA